MRIDPIRLAVIIGVGVALYFGLTAWQNPAFAKTVLLGYGMLGFKFYEALAPIEGIIQPNSA